jgi:hypothetical protein
MSKNIEAIKEINKTMNLLGIEMILLILGVGTIVFGILQVIRNVGYLIESVYKQLDWSWNIKHNTIIITIGILLVIISQNI